MKNLKEKISLIIFVLITSLVAFAQSESKKLIVSIDGVKNKPGGTIICSLFDKEDGFPKDSSKALETVDAKNINDSWQCEFASIKEAQSYAVSVLHDENGNRKLDTNAFGVPLEGWATSQNVTHTFRAPDFKESEFKVESNNLKISVEMHY